MQQRSLTGSLKWPAKSCAVREGVARCLWQGARHATHLATSLPAGYL